MLERISTLQIYQTGIAQILERQAELARTRDELSTGRRLLSPVDDPAAAVRALDIEQDLREVDQFQRNAALAEGQLSLQDRTLSNITRVLRRVRELTVQANNATQGPEQRASIARELDSRLNELAALANTRDANDEYIFGGFQARSQPFTESAGAVTYRGDDGQRFLDIAAGSQVAVRDSGRRVFLDIPAGNGRFDFSVSGNTGTAVVAQASADSRFVRGDYRIDFAQATPADPLTYRVLDRADRVVAEGEYRAGAAIAFNGARVVVTGKPADGDAIRIDGAASRSMFATVSTIAAALRGASGSPASNAEVHNALASGLYNLDQAIGNVLDVQADVGSRLNRVDAQRAINAEFNVQLKQTLSELRDLDYTEAASRLRLQLFALRAAQQTFAVTAQRLSLFNYL